MDRFFVLRSYPDERETDAVTRGVEADPMNVGEPTRCEACGDYTSGFPWVPPFRVELEAWGRRFADYVALFGDHLVSDRLKRLIEEHNITGFQGFEPVELVRVRRMKGSKVKGAAPAYYHVTIVRSQAAVDLAKSGVEWEPGKGPKCSVCRVVFGLKGHERVILEPGTWSGEDVFEPRGLSVPLTTERFKNLCEENGMAQTVFVAAEEYGTGVPRARQLLAHPLDGTVLEKVRPNGEVWRYCPRTNEMAIRRADGTVNEAGQLIGGQAWWDSQ